MTAEYVYVSEIGPEVGLRMSSAGANSGTGRRRRAVRGQGDLVDVNIQLRLHTNIAIQIDKNLIK